MPLPPISTIDWAAISRFADSDTSRLALNKLFQQQRDAAFLLQQISGRQTAKRKIPMWAAADKIIYPLHLSLEQCSSETTARYKAAVATRLLSSLPIAPATDRQYLVADLTGGFGVDFFFIATAVNGLFKEQQSRFLHFFADRQEDLCLIASHNFCQLGLNNVDIRQQEASVFIDEGATARLLFLDPARRNSSGQRTYSIADCSPDYLSMEDRLLDSADIIMLKLSPMLDCSDTLKRLKHVAELHIVGTRHECRELITVISRHHTSQPLIYCHADSDTISFPAESVLTPVSVAESVGEGMTLVVPTAVVMKSGAYGYLCQQFGLKAIASQSHLFIADDGAADSLPQCLFRRFKIATVAQMNRTQLKTALAGIKKANVAVRNFPLSADALKRRLRVKDGSDNYIFGTTDRHSRHIIILAKPL